MNYLITLVTILLISSPSLTSAQSTRILQGDVTLDVAPNTKNRLIELTVRNHSLVVIPPTFAIIRPIISSRITRVDMPRGSSQINYSIDGISRDAVNYSIKLRCIGCESDFPTQYYSPQGNKFSLADAIYLAPETLPSTLSLTAITRATISGKLVLDEAATRDLTFAVTVFSANQRQIIFKSVRGITLPSGNLSTTYTVTGINRNNGGDQLGVRVQCTNCYGSSNKPVEYPAALSPNQNHILIDFAVTNINLSIAPSIYLLLLDTTP